MPNFLCKTVACLIMIVIITMMISIIFIMRFDGFVSVLSYNNNNDDDDDDDDDDDENNDVDNANSRTKNCLYCDWFQN